MKMFLGAPIELDAPDFSLPGLSVLFKLFVLLSILALGALFWGGAIWLGLQYEALLTSPLAIYVEGIDPVQPYYHLGWGRESL